MGLFKPGLLSGDILYLDLDVVVTDQVAPLIEAYESDKTKLWSLDDFSYSVVGRAPDDIGGHQQGTINSSVMLWNADETFQHDVYHYCTAKVMEELHGDQNHITRTLWPEHIRLLPKGIAHSYKYGNNQMYPITVFHGSPKCHEVEDKWVLENWAV